jgi:hypothetical protein
MTQKIPLRFHAQPPESPQPGDCWRDPRFAFPGCDAPRIVRVSTHTAHGDVNCDYLHLYGKWGLTGDIGPDGCTLTLTPSIYINRGLGVEKGEWHGFITAGVIEPCHPF